MKNICEIIIFIEKVVKDTIALSGGIALGVFFNELFIGVLDTYFKNNPIIYPISKVLSILSMPIFTKIIKQQLGYSEEECRNIYDLLRDYVK